MGSEKAMDLAFRGSLRLHLDFDLADRSGPLFLTAQHVHLLSLASVGLQLPFHLYHGPPSFSNARYGLHISESISNRPIARNFLDNWRCASSFLVAQLIVIFPDSPSEVGDPNYQKGFLLAAGCLAPILFTPLISVHAAFERPPPPPTEEDIENDRLWAMGCRGKLKRLFRFLATFVSAMRNALSFRPFLLFCLITTCSQIPITCFVANFVLFSKYTLHTESLTKYELLTLQLTFFCSAPVWSFAIKYIGKKSCFYVGAVGWVASEVALFFLIAPVNVALLFSVLVCRGIFASVAQLIPMAILPDVCGQYERATTRRSEGLFFSIDLLTSKLAQAIVSGLSLYIIGAVGYQNPIVQTDEQREENYQPPSVVLMLRILVCILPIPFILITIIFMYYIPETDPVFVLQGRCTPFVSWLRRLLTSRLNRYETIDEPK